MFFFSVCVQAEWVALNYVPFAEQSLEVVVDLYQKTACHKAVINETVLQNIIKVTKQKSSVYKTDLNNYNWFFGVVNSAE